jgi:signal transduction histidine kinase
MRTPIAQIIMAADLINQHALRKNYEFIEDMSDALVSGAKRLGNEVDEILLYLNIPNITKTGSCFAIAELEKRVQEICNELGIHQASIQISSDLSQSSLSLSDRAMDVILRAVIGNSLKFHPQLMPDLSVCVQAAGQNQLHLKIMDDGVFLAPDDLHKVWLPYYQVEREFTGEVEGMGLGLPGVANLVWEVGGKCKISNREDRPGVVLDFVLPTV